MEQQCTLDSLVRRSAVTVMLEVGAVRELHLKAETTKEYSEWRYAFTRQIEYANIAAQNGYDLIIPPEAIPKSVELDSQVPVLERSFSKIGTFTRKNSNVGSMEIGSFGEISEITDRNNEPDSIDKIEILTVLGEQVEKEHSGVSLKQKSEGDARNSPPETDESSSSIVVGVSTSTVGADANQQNSVAGDDWPGATETATTVTGDTRSAGTASTEANDDEEEEGIILTSSLKPEKSEECNPTYVEISKGYFLKQGHFFKNWKRRFFVLDNGVLYYYEKDIPGITIFLMFLSFSNIMPRLYQALHMAAG